MISIAQQTSSIAQQRWLIQSYRIIFQMNQTLSLPHLLSCLTQKDQYKGTQAYLSEIQHFNEEIYGLIDQALKQTLLEIKTAPFTKLMSLRFFKEIMMSANFSLIDLIDERIEEQIIHAAQYNKKSKQANRGINYFAETCKLKNDAQIQKISNSYVLLALEIILKFGKWYVVDQDGEQTRFVQYYRELCAAGVTFPPENQLNFFKKDDEEKFRKNYKKWAQYFIQASGNGKSNEGPANKAESKPVEQKNVTFSSQVGQQSTLKNKTAVKKQEEKPQKADTLNISPSIIMPNTENQQLKALLLQKDETINKMKTDLKKQQEKSTLIENQLNNQKLLIAKIQQQLKIAKGNIEKLTENSKNQECYQILISPPKNTDDLIEEIDLLQDMMQSSTEGFQKQKKTIQVQLNQLKIENQSLKKTIKLHEQQLQKVKEQQQQDKLMEEQRLIQQKVFKNLSAESFGVTDQPKIGSKQMEEKQMIIIKEQIFTSRKEVLKDFSNTNKAIREQLSDICQNKIEDTASKQSRQGSRSLKKTESQHRLKMNQTTMTAANFRKTNYNQSKLVKTASSFKNRDENNKMVTIFPFLEAYFPVLPAECRNFKQHCLTQLNEPFFQNELIKVALAKPTTTESYFIYVYNKTNAEQKVKLMANHTAISVEGQKSKKVPSLTAAQFELKLQTADINMRYPSITIIMGNHGISLTNSTNQKRFTLPLPITLLDYFKIRKTTKFDSLLQSSKTIKHGINKFVMKYSLSTFQQLFPSLIPELRCGQTMRAGYIECGKSALRIQFSQKGRETNITMEGLESCELCMALSKVLLQVLMWVLRD